MAGLIEKDMRLLWCNKLSVIAFVVFAVIVEASVKGAILGYLPFVMCLLMVNTIAYDEMDNGYQFLLTFPIDRKTYGPGKICAYPWDGGVFLGCCNGDLFCNKNDTGGETGYEHGASGYA